MIAQLAIKGKGSVGNILTKNKVKKIENQKVFQLYLQERFGLIQM